MKFVSIILSLFFCIQLQLNAQVNITYKSPTTARVEIIEQQATFDTTSIDFGKVKKGDKRNTQFVFTNTGARNLEIELVSACECTTLDWTRGPIPPRETGVIEVIFDSTEKEESETIDIDIYFKELEGSKKDPLFEIVNFSFELEK